MPEIPVYERKVGLDAGGTPSPQLTGLPSSASGANVAESVGGLGKSIEGAADAAAHIIAYKQKLDSQEKVDNLSEQAASEWQDRAHGDGGWLTRQGDAAKGITAGTYPPDYVGEQKDGIKYKDSFDGFSAELKKKYMAQATSEFERRALNHSMDAHERVYRNAVITHEAQQSKVARQQASEAAVDALKNTGVDAATVGDLQHVTDQGMDERERALRNDGHTDKTVIDAVRMKTADEFADAAVHANLERDPEAAQALLDGVKPKLSNLMSATLQARVDGKMTSIRADAINKQIADDPQSKNVDGTFNLGFVEKKAAELASTRPTQERDHLVKMAKEQATMADSALRQQKEQSTRGFLDGFSELRDKGVPFQEAEKLVLSKYGGVFGPSEIDKLRSQAVNIYRRDPSAIEARLNVMNTEQKRGYADAVNIIKTKYKQQTSTIPGEEQPVKLSDAMIQQLKEVAPKMNRQQIMDWTNSQLKEVPTKPGYLGFLKGETTQWEEVHSLQTRYTADKIAAARDEIMRTKGGKPPTYVELEAKLRGR